MRRMAWAGLAIGAAAVAPLPVSAMPVSALPQVDAEGSIAARGGEAVRFEDAASVVDSRLPFSADPDAAFGAPVQFNNASRLSAETGQLRQEAWFAGDGFTDRLRITTTGELRHADGSPAPPRALDPVAFSGESYDVTYTRGWTAASGRTPSGLEVSLTPHAGFGVGSDGPSAEAGATLRIGENLDRLAPNGDEAFGERPRWYLYAAGSKRAVGYNFARTRDGDFARSGVSQDAGTYLGDASIGVAYRRGAVQSSFGVVYREIEAKGLRGYQGINTDVSEGLVAFQLTIRPPR
ncbi:lipid A-modifier LpxR family protein [Brevundimonas naejangsanensis]|uniref:lipid A-modifier LpxR family protein n=1 Tax=Brevundimonas naejangsanensis TaxID=588932 RepID=UPI000406645E|nr:lipid A-modifier LpxR family protein [Brevundimonas naejangsanensis]